MQYIYISFRLRGYKINPNFTKKNWIVISFEAFFFEYLKTFFKNIYMVLRCFDYANKIYGLHAAVQYTDILHIYTCLLSQ